MISMRVVWVAMGSFRLVGGRNSDPRRPMRVCADYFAGLIQIKD
jgi:hypothetical protein